MLAVALGDRDRTWTCTQGPGSRVPRGADEKSIRLAGKLYCIVVRYRSVCDGAAQHIG